MIGLISDLFHEQLGLGFFCTPAGLFVDDGLPGWWESIYIEFNLETFTAQIYRENYTLLQQQLLI